MQRFASRLIVGLAIAGLVLAGCTPTATTKAPKEEAVHVEEQASGLKLLTLSAHAAERLGVQTAEAASRGSGIVIPYSAVIYDASGATWTYTTAEELVFQRAAISIEDIEGDEAILSEGPVEGTAVVTVGAAMLYGVETGVGGGH